MPRQTTPPSPVGSAWNRSPTTSSGSPVSAWGQPLSSSSSNDDVEKDVVEGCAELGNRLLLQHRLRNPEGVSRELFSSALQLVRNRDLYDPGRSEVADGRRELADEVDRVLRAIDEIDRIDRRRRVADPSPTNDHSVSARGART